LHVMHILRLWLALAVHYRAKMCIIGLQVCLDSTKMSLGITRHILDGQMANQGKKQAVLQ
jgi:hypothetical protein